MTHESVAVFFVIFYLIIYIYFAHWSKIKQNMSLGISHSRKCPNGKQSHVIQRSNALAPNVRLMEPGGRLFTNLWFISQFQMKVAMIKKISHVLIPVINFQKLFQCRQHASVNIAHFILPKLEINNLLLICIMLSPPCGEALRD